MYKHNAKDKNIQMLNQRALNKTLSMFEWENLPIPKVEFEKQLQQNGYSLIFKDGESFYCSPCSFGAELDFYGNPTKATVINPYVKINKTFTIGEDCILAKNDFLQIGLKPIFEHYNSLLIENEINLVMYGYSSRSQILLTASDNRTKQNADLFLKKLIDGEISSIAENPIFDGLKSLNLNSNNSAITQLIELNQYYKGSFYHEIGLNANIMMKKERLITSEVENTGEIVYPFLYNMLENRLNFCKEMQEIFKIDIQVDFGSVWKAKAVENVDNVVNNDPLNEPISDTIDEPKDEPNDEPNDEPKDEPNENPTGEKQLILEMLEDESMSEEDKQVLKEMLENVS